MSDSPIDERGYNDLLTTIENYEAWTKADRLLIEHLKSDVESAREAAQRDFSAANQAIGAIYKMVELIQATNVTHAQREGNFLLLLAFITKAWPSHNGRFVSTEDASYIPF